MYQKRKGIEKLVINFSAKYNSIYYKLLLALTVIEKPCSSLMVINQTWALVHFLQCY